MKIKGTVSQIVFCNAENGYTVVELEVDGCQVTAVGVLPLLTCGEVLSLEGKYIMHPKFGTQFELHLIHLIPLTHLTAL